MTDLVIRRLTTVEEFDCAVDLQKIYWGSEGEALVPMHMLHSITHNGGHVLGAYDGDVMIGFVIGFIGTNIDYEEADAPPVSDGLLIMSKRMVVLPEYRGQNIGYLLKMAQRDVAIKQGIPLVSWTFDPLLAPNAHLNIRKLGGIVAKYKVDYFGQTNQVSLQADRLVVELWVNHQRLVERANDTVEHRTLQQYIAEGVLLLNSVDISGQYFMPASIMDADGADMVLVEIPSNFRELDANDSGLAQAWRDHIREIFVPLLANGYVVTDFVRGDLDKQNRTFYLLSCSFDSEL